VEFDRENCAGAATRTLARLRIEAWAHSLGVPQASQRQSRADEEHGSESSLDHNQHGAMVAETSLLPANLL